MLHFRPLLVSDQQSLWRWLHIALWDPPPAPPRPSEVLQNPGVRIYAEGWGTSSDLGVVAVVDGEDAGACWMRLVPERQGLAYVDDETPQLGIALEPTFQNRGFGKPMMKTALVAAWQQGYRQVSLTVHPDNPARFMYQACDFKEVGLRGTYHLMVAASSA
ncbi:GNAT family N-acetyltransferase [Rubrivivax sp. RP6-9]|uniref:GNAT family N-acetyltransferase n=1 Tax=Rubrivivax sp. RP6-9 TaxID=3415750 RepID=UPI003CC59F74